MNDGSEQIGSATNGAHKVAEGERLRPTPQMPTSFDQASIDERLAALRETIRTWDWRTARVHTVQTPSDTANGVEPPSGPGSTGSVDAEQLTAESSTSTVPLVSAESLVEVRPDVEQSTEPESPTLLPPPPDSTESVEATLMTAEPSTLTVPLVSAESFVEARPDVEQSTEPESPTTVLPPQPAIVSTSFAQHASLSSDSPMSTMVPTTSSTSTFTDDPTVKPIGDEPSPATSVGAPPPPPISVPPLDAEPQAAVAAPERFDVADQPLVTESAYQEVVAPPPSPEDGIPSDWDAPSLTEPSASPAAGVAAPESFDTGEQPVVTEPTPRAAVAPPPPTEDVTAAAGDATSWFGSEPEAQPEPNGAIRQLWSRPWAKTAVLFLAVAVVVILIVGGIRLATQNNNNAGSGEISSTTTTSHVSSSHQNGHTAAPISAAQLTQYDGYASALQNANFAATEGLIKAGSTPTPSRIVLVVVGYEKAVNNYHLDLRQIQWPASMQGAVAADTAQLRSLTTFLQSFSTVTPSGVPAWLSQFHQLSSTTQTADNQVRHDLGLPNTTSFP